MNNWLIRTKVDLADPTCIDSATDAGLIYSGDDQAHKWVIDCYYGCTPADLTGYTAQGVFMRSDGATVPVIGSIEQNIVTIILSRACYVVPGSLRGIVRIVNPANGVSTTIGSMSVHVSAVETDTVINPDGLIPDITRLLAEIENMRTLGNTLSQEEGERVTSEAARAESETQRVRNERTRANAENERNTAEFSRNLAESERNNAEISRAKAEFQRGNAESNRVRAEDKRAEAEQLRVYAENTRGNTESERQTAENQRALTEKTRVTQEEQRASAENERSLAETARNHAESQRNAAESARANAEIQRDSAEQERIRAEQNRISADQTLTESENQRIDGENKRIEAEQVRNQAEAQRVQAEIDRVNTENVRQAALAAAVEAAAQSARDAEYSEESVESLAKNIADTEENVGNMVQTIAKEPTAQDILAIAQQQLEALRQIAENGMGGSLNGFEFALGEGGKLIINYTNPDDETDTASAVFATDSTAEQIVAELSAINDTLHDMLGTDETAQEVEHG